ncbi:hypothetical protein RB653_007222 [Dictyostelium firmibasis]|uniref:FNIP repeat-containing protein n=1 Tax=Dictyostelium firmibasis TaxID=79012 RepID=A0AAN7TNA5_9MYCE
MKNYNLIKLLIKGDNEKENEIENKIDNEILFFSIWRNKYLRDKITKEIKIYLNANRLVRFKDCEQLNQYEYKDSLSKVIIENPSTPTINIPLNITELEFDPKSDYAIIKSTLPSHIEKLYLNYNYSYVIPTNFFNSSTSLKELRLGGLQYITDFKIPESVTNLNLGYLVYGNLKLPPNFIPQSVTILNTGELSQALHNSLTPLPKNLKELTFGKVYNNIIKSDHLATSLTKLTFGGNYDRVLPKLGSNTSITSLTFGGKFTNEKYQFNVGDLPQNLTYLDLGHMFNMPLVKNVLPNSLKTLKLSKNYDHSLFGEILPRCLKTLHLGQKFNKQINEGDLPNQLEEITLSWNFCHSISNFPNSITTFIMEDYFKGPLEKLPSSLTKLNVKTGYYSSLKPNIIPSSVQDLMISSYQIAFSPNIIPSSCIRLSICFGSFEFQSNNSSTELDSIPIFPNSIQYLNFGRWSNKLLPSNILPTSLTTLIFGSDYNQPLNAILKPLHSLKIIEFGNSFNQPIKNDDDNNENTEFPQNITSIKFGYSFNQTIKPNSFPNLLKHLGFGVKFSNGDKDFQENSIPPLVESIVFKNLLFNPTNLPKSLISLNNKFL